MEQVQNYTTEEASNHGVERRAGGGEGEEGGDGARVWLLQTEEVSGFLV